MWGKKHSIYTQGWLYVYRSFSAYVPTISPLILRSKCYQTPQKNNNSSLFLICPVLLVSVRIVDAILPRPSSKNASGFISMFDCVFIFGHDNPIVVVHDI